MENIIRYSITFVIVALLQILVFNNIPAIGMISPYLYLLFVLMLPVNMSSTLAMFLSFVMGIIIDLSTHSLGVHASASTMLAFARPMVLTILQPRQGYVANTVPIVSHFGIPWALKYISICVFIHHVMLYICFTFTVDGLGFLFVRMCINTVLTILTIIVVEYFVIKR